MITAIGWVGGFIGYYLFSHGEKMYGIGVFVLTFIFVSAMEISKS